MHPLVATLTHLALAPIEGAVLFELHKLCATFSASVNMKEGGYVRIVDNHCVI
jgi:hypothetical protein